MGIFQDAVQGVDYAAALQKIETEIKKVNSREPA